MQHFEEFLTERRYLKNVSDKTLVYYRCAFRSWEKHSEDFSGASGYNRSLPVPLTVFETKGIPATRRERIESRYAGAGKHAKELCEAWISTDPFRGVQVLITGPLGFERSVQFAMDGDSHMITERVWATLEE